MNLWCPQVCYLIPSSGCLPYPRSLSLSEPFLHVGLLSVCLTYVGFPCICIEFGSFLLTICLLSIWLLDSQKNLEGKGKFVPPPRYPANSFPLYIYFPLSFFLYLRPCGGLFFSFLLPPWNNAIVKSRPCFQLPVLKPKASTSLLRAVWCHAGTGT